MTDAIEPSSTGESFRFATPAFVELRPDGLYILTAQLADAGEFVAFLDSVHGSGARFSGMDYELMQKLAFDEEALPFFRHSLYELRLAAAIAPFSENRTQLYHTIKSQDAGRHVEYLFEPVSMEEAVQQPVYGAPDAVGVRPVVSHHETIVETPTRLDFDEFVAAMWQKGVKFGLDEPLIRATIASRETARITIAHQLEPTTGTDAEIVESSPDMHRDDTPKILPNGKADLTQFKNRFPQMAKGSVLFRKIPCKPGRPGCTIGGAAIAPKPPKDLDLHKLVSEGTEVVTRADGECIVATMDGFLTLDAKTNKVSVTEKIENKGGVSVKTTGDLTLSVDEFIEHGEVQEGRVVKGRNMSFMSDVFGHVKSEGGTIRFHKNLSGGLAETRSGDIVCNGRILRSAVQTGDGTLTAEFCESSKLVARRVVVEHAVSCEIVADEVEAVTLEGCLVAARHIHIHKTAEYRGKECLITLLTPDLRDLDQLIAKAASAIRDSTERVEANAQQLAQLMADADFAKFCGIVQRVQKGEIRISAEQTAAWRKLLEKHTDAFNHARKLHADNDAMHKIIRQSEEVRVKAELDRHLACEGISCVIDQVRGQTTGQTMRSAKGAQLLATMSASQIADTLHRMDDGKHKIFSEDAGALKWQLSEPAENAPQG